MALKFPAAFRTTRAGTVTTRAGNGALLRIYDGTRAADADTAIGAQVLLAELVCGTPFAPGAASGVLTANAITQDSSANASGTATWFRLLDSAGTTTVMDGSVTASGGGGDLQLVTTTVVATQPVQVTSFVLTEGGA
jgi:hypothetical protein